MAMVYDALSVKYPCALGVGFKPDIMVLSVSHFLQAPDDMPESRAFVLPVSELPDPKDEFHVSYGRIIAVAKPGQASDDTFAMTVCTDAPISEIIYVIECSLRRYRSWFTSFSNSAIMGASVQDLVNQAHDLLENPIIVLDKAMRIRARTVHDVIDDEMWNPLDPTIGTFSSAINIEDEAPGLMSLLGIFEETRLVRNHLSFNDHTLAAARTREIGGSFLFICLVEKNRPITDSDIEVLKALIDMIEVSLKTSGNWAINDALGFDGLLIDAFKGRIDSSIELQNRMHMLGHELDERYCIMVAVPEKGHMNDRQAHRLINDISINYSFGECVIYDGSLVFFSTYGEGRGPKPYDFIKFESFLEKSSMMAGISQEYCTKIPLSAGYETACAALSIGRRINGSARIFFFDECRPYYPYEICFRKKEYELFIHPSLNKLSEYDSAHDTALRSVMACLVKNWGNRSKTAKELYIQRNTLQSRIRAIEGLCGIDLSDAATLAHIHRSFELLAYCGKTFEE